MTAPPSLVLITGAEELLVDRAIAGAVAAAGAAQPGVERREAGAAGLTPAAFADLVSPSLFAEPRVVVVRGAHEAVKETAQAIVDYLADPADGVTLVVQHSGGARNKSLVDAVRKAGAGVIACDPITRVADRTEFVRREIRGAGGTATPQAAAALVDAVGSDLRELATACAQLVADSGGMVDETAVRRYHRGRADISGFSVADLAVAGDVPGALEALRWARTVGGVAEVLIADALADGIRTVARVRSAGSGNAYALAGELGMPPWKVEKAQRFARGWSEPALARAVDVVADLNGAVKGLAADPDYALERAVLDLAAARRLR